MILSKREKYIAAATIITVAILVLDWYVLTPVLGRQASLEAEQQTLLGDLAQANALFKRRVLLGRKWRELLDAGMGRGVAEAESQVLHALRDWSQESRLTLTSLKPEKVAERGDLLEMSFQAAGTGPMSAIARFLWRIETARIPIRIERLQLGARREGADDLSLQLNVSSLCLPPARQPSATPAGTKATGKGTS